MNTQHVTLQRLTPFYGPVQAVQPVDASIAARAITAIIGPSGCGKSTVLRCINRMHETLAYARVEGQVLLGSQDIYAPGVEAQSVRRRIGMVFQQPNPLRMLSIFENVAIGMRLEGLPRNVVAERVEASLKAAALWDEVKDKLGHSGLALSGGQQQRLCIARAIALQPEVLLLDEPCSALDPISTYKIEELLIELKQNFTIVIVTHNMQQAARVADRTMVFMVDRTQARPIGVLVEEGETNRIFTAPRDPRTEEYISGRIG
ncbi:MAG TPA: phosphate ABC transporter ATP-binding protein PstB [Kouleothrix sp.]|uniref:phosphate ABC transporter ATP-binding protein PstB n=1 Tax=Kouleothrix sp. TaxID=2779161 RepID=UPI002CBD6D56|nr:phosphate ABC transporter ATP-binding protein PstB [Kouleothrix sp.]HRC74979.1 phosphate ABC transporter ATP-binding protein PstB [Kouleothrix sp.]